METWKPTNRKYIPFFKSYKLEYMGGGGEERRGDGKGYIMLCSLAT